MHTIRDQATVHANTELNIFAHQNPSYARHQVVSSETTSDHTYERLSLYEIPIQVNTDTAVTTERIMDSSSFYGVNADLDEGTGGTYVSVMDSTGDSYVTII